MKIEHPCSFWLAVALTAVLVALTVVWSLAHLLELLANIGLVWALREMAWYEGHRCLSPPRRWWSCW